MPLPAVGTSAIHQGPGRVWLYVPVPASGARAVLDSSGNVAQPSGIASWAATTAYAVGNIVKDANVNTWVCIVAGTSGSSTPFPGSSPTEGAAPVTDGSGTPPLAWAFCGGAYGAYYAGASQGAKTVTLTPKYEEITADEISAPIDVVATGDAYEIDAEMSQSELGNVISHFPLGSFTSGTDTNQPSGLQAYEEITFGGILAVPKIGVAVVSPRRDVAGKNVISHLYQAYQAEAVKLPYQRAKETMFSVKWKGIAISTRAVGDQVGQIWRQT